ncbi:MAG TPA: NADP-dependent oxidoreductase [Caulobacteraceae bacterium]|jgi:NADPH:quinone reductase-like Zn-dependent oxidoreductase|nr:NADP-dependent oxidoreductase [Caulobacteraceae bacterium]
MSIPASAAGSMKAIRFHAYGEPADVLRLEEAAVPSPGADRIRVRVHACGLNPADWALCRGLFAGDLPRGVGLDVSGVVDAVGDGVVDVSVGDPVLGSADFGGYASAGLADYAVLSHWTRVPPGLDMTQAAALTMAVETAFRSIEGLGVAKDHTLLVHGGGTMMGFAAVQMALMRGARVIATAGDTFTERLRAIGAKVTPYGVGMVQRVREIADGSPDLILDTAGGHDVLVDLIEIAGGDPRRVLTISSDFQAASALGVRHSFTEGVPLQYGMLGDFARLAAEGRFTVPVARTFAFEEWREALAISLSGHAHGKLVIVPA